MDPQLLNSLIALAVVILGGLGTLFTALIALVVIKLDANTRLTKQSVIASSEAKDASNGRLTAVLDLLERERTISAGLRAQLCDARAHAAQTEQT